MYDEFVRLCGPECSVRFGHMERRDNGKVNERIYRANVYGYRGKAQPNRR